MTPLVDGCPFFGEANPTEVLLNGRLFRALAAHELGHTLSLGHASRWTCNRQCTIDEYGNAFSVMGGGDGDFNAWEKSALGWLGAIARPGRNGTHELGPVEGPTMLPQALVVTTAASEFWFESRGLATPSFTGDAVQPAGIAVLAGPAAGGELSAYPRANLLLPNPAGGGRYAYGPGEAFVRPGSSESPWSATRSRARRFGSSGSTASDRDVRDCACAQHGAGSGSRGTQRGSAGAASTATRWSSTAAAVRRFRSDIELTTWTAAFRVARGFHRVGVYATDRAGNRGRLVSTRIRIRS